MLLEYSFFRIAETLEVGPKLHKCYSYDLIAYDDGIEFAMERCFLSPPPIEGKSLQEDILKGLKILHTFKIVHQDIKPNNIAWSEKQQQWVFLDFGFARCLKEELGEKTKTKFIGTYSYTSAEMKKIYHLDIGTMVDLYYNDLHSARVTINTIKASLEDKEDDDTAYYM